MDQPEPKVNLLHPLATLAEWKEYSRMPVGMRDAQAVVLRDRVYIGGGDTPTGPSSDLLIYDFKRDSWERIKTPTQLYSLAVYRSQLVLVGGVVCSHNTVTNKIWVLDKKDTDEPEGCWDASLIPAMPTERFGTSAVGVDNHLIVAGGDKGGLDGRLKVVEVYDGHKWRTVQPLPRPCSRMKSVVHEGFWYLAGGVDQGKKVFYASFEALTAPGSAEQTGIWVVLPDAPLERSTPVIFGMQLTTVGGLFRSAIHAYSHRTRSWVPVGKMPVAHGFSCSVVLPNGELLMVGGKTHHGISSDVFRTKLQTTPFPDGKFTLNDLDRLEAVSGISVYEQLAPELLPKMASTLHLDAPALNNPKQLFEEWILGKGALPPTWPILVGVLLGVRPPLGSEIENFFNTQTPTTQAVSLLLEQKKKNEQSPSGEEKIKSEAALGKVKVENQEIQAEDTAQEQECMEALEKELQRCHNDREADMWRNKSLMAQNEELRRELQHIEPGCMEKTGYLRGVDVIAETSVQVTNEAQTFSWVGYGLKLNIPPGALPADLKECELLMKVGLSGQFELPQNTSLVSAVYWLDSEPRCKFSKHLTLEIQHCVKPTNTSKLRFIRAKCTQKHLPYKFKDIERGVFTSDSAYGSVELDQFSGMGIVDENPVSDRVYCAFLYYLRRGINQRDIHFVITWNSEPHTTVVQQEYIARGATTGPDLPVEFESNSISLQLPTEGITFEDGWRIIPLFNPEITREKVDNFMIKTETGRIPSCQLTAVWTRQSKPPVLVHQVTLKGAKESSNFFSIVLDCDSIPPDRVEALSLKNLMDALYHTMANRWKAIGVQLEISNLETIETKHRGDPQDCLLGMLGTWLKRVDPPPTWSAVIKAVEFLGEEQLGKELKEKYCQL